MSPVVHLALTLVALCLVFGASFVLASRIDNYGIVDVVWSYSFGGGAVWFAVSSGGWGPRSLLVSLLVIAWSLRLGSHLAVRVARAHPIEDGRYRAMRERWRGRFGITMFGFFQLQALSVVVLALPVFLVARNETPEFAAIEYVGVALWVAALVGESMADRQLAVFKRDPANHGRVCTVGLWGWSRHPNYFCEWLVWLAYALLAWPASAGWLGLIAPAAMLYLLLCVSGVPPTEEHLMRSKGEAYRRYQRTTPAFFPWPPRRSSLAGTT